MQSSIHHESTSSKSSALGSRSSRRPGCRDALGSAPRSAGRTPRDMLEFSMVDTSVPDESLAIQQRRCTGALSATELQHQARFDARGFVPDDCVQLPEQTAVLEIPSTPILRPVSQPDTLVDTSPTTWRLSSASSQLERGAVATKPLTEDHVPMVDSLVSPLSTWLMVQKLRPRLPSDEEDILDEADVLTERAICGQNMNQGADQASSVYPSMTSTRVPSSRASTAHSDLNFRARSLHGLQLPSFRCRSYTSGSRSTMLIDQSLSHRLRDSGDATCSTDWK